MKVGGEEVKLIYEASFEPVRKKFRIVDDFLDGDNFKMESLKPGGGKGGDLLGFTKDKLYIVKEVNKGDQRKPPRVPSPFVVWADNCHTFAVTLDQNNEALCKTYMRSTACLLAERGLVRHGVDT